MRNIHLPLETTSVLPVELRAELVAVKLLLVELLSVELVFAPCLKEIKVVEVELLGTFSNKGLSNTIELQSGYFRGSSNNH